ncbi:synaptic vesicle glycoprotein 2C-like isoform X3 [Sipha flava]|uniref:Synaptic vesicle glycoprotein 2C-like isoform X3 n=1 Tax=Sipha flava TaxID=143950 RepID=A0A8B8GKI6_9HEMI|nr:synaptic vesicle glycoprotein 2C-like isoform X3 [Sipha flava]
MDAVARTGLLVQLRNYLDDVVTTTTFLTAQSVRLDKAIEMIGFGKFHYYMLFICGTVYIAVSISLTSVSFIVPSAQCDFQMTSFRKGFLNGASMIGMCIGSFIWGYISDSYGRRKALIFCMLMDGLFNLVSSVSQIYSVFIFCRMMSGFGVSGCTITYAYLGEFLNAKYREKFLCWMEIFWTIGVILLPCIAWIIIPQTFRIESGFFLFRSWNLFVIICSLPSIITTCLLMLLPESPKYLLVKGKHEETLDCLRFVHRWNNKKTDQSFPVISLTLPDRISETSKGFFSGMGKSLFELITSKYKTVLAITCIMQFCVTARVDEQVAMVRDNVPECPEQDDHVRSVVHVQSRTERVGRRQVQRRHRRVRVLEHPDRGRRLPASLFHRAAVRQQTRAQVFLGNVSVWVRLDCCLLVLHLVVDGNPRVRFRV